MYPRTARPRGHSTSTRNVRDGSMIGSSVHTRTWPPPSSRLTTVNWRSSRCCSRATPASSNWAGEPSTTFSPSRLPLRTPSMPIRASSGSYSADRSSIGPSSSAAASRGAITSRHARHAMNPCIVVVPRITVPSTARPTPGSPRMGALHPLSHTLHAPRAKCRSSIRYRQFNPSLRLKDIPSPASPRSERC